MSKRITVSSLGWNTLTKEVPSTIDEYNALDPKRENPVLEDAIDERMKHQVLSNFRPAVLAELGKAVGVEQINHGTEEDPQWESDAKWKKRIMIAAIAASGGDANSATDVAKWHESTAAIAQKHMDAVEFKVAAKEAGAGGVSKVGKQDLATAQQAIDKGVAEKFAGLLSKALNRPVGVTQEEIAIAIKDKRKNDADAEAKRQAAVLDELAAS